MDTLLLFNFLGPEMLVIFFAILLLFGGKKIPELMRGIGRGIREFNAARNSLESELKDGMRDAEQQRQLEMQHQQLQQKIAQQQKLLEQQQQLLQQTQQQQQQQQQQSQSPWIEEGK